jgi:hypothetical protein
VLTFPPEARFAELRQLIRKQRKPDTIKLSNSTALTASKLLLYNVEDVVRLE